MKNSLVLLICGFFILTATICSCRKGEPDLPVVTTAPVTNIMGTSALTGGDIVTDGGSPITVRGVCWSIGPNPTIADLHTSDSSGTGSYTSAITGLQPETTYYVKAYAGNKAGIAYGQAIIFETDWGQSGTFTDTRYNKEYKWVRIGDQIWMAENLAYLPAVNTALEGSYTNPYYYVYDYSGTNVNDAKATVNYNTYGVLYNWPAAMAGSATSSTNPSGVQGVCPTGWHLPADAEWKELTDYLGGESVAGGKLKETGITHWLSPNTGATNETGFTALPGGDRNNHGAVAPLNQTGFWWSATENLTDSSWGRFMESGTSLVTRFYSHKDYGFSVRCVRD
ncbi:MAG: fibrobacter succinogenes major paralogous domain-containing protein [Bacteroidales bacterium]